jgi:hypothetical protein
MNITLRIVEIESRERYEKMEVYDTGIIIQVFGIRFPALLPRFFVPSLLLYSYYNP